MTCYRGWQPMAPRIDLSHKQVRSSPPRSDPAWGSTQLCWSTRPIHSICLSSPPCWSCVPVLTLAAVGLGLCSKVSTSSWSWEEGYGDFGPVGSLYVSSGIGQQNVANPWLTVWYAVNHMEGKENTNFPPTVFFQRKCGKLKGILNSTSVAQDHLMFGFCLRGIIYKYATDSLKLM